METTDDSGASLTKKCGLRWIRADLEQEPRTREPSVREPSDCRRDPRPRCGCSHQTSAEPYSSLQKSIFFPTRYKYYQNLGETLGCVLLKPTSSTPVPAYPPPLRTAPPPPPLPPNSRPAPPAASRRHPMAVSVFPDGNGSKLGGGGGGGGQGADGENAPGEGNELVLDVKGLINGVRNEGSHFGDNYESRNLRNRLPRVAPEWVASIQVNNSFENRKKGLLSSFYTIAEKLLVFCGSLVILSLSYPLAANAKEAFEDHAMQGIIIGSVISFFICCLLTALASYLRDSESIDGVGFHVFKWLVLLVFLFLSAGLCVILRFCAHTPKAVLWTLGTVGYFIILSIWVWVFYIEVLQIQEEMKKHFEMETRAPSEGPGHVPPLAAPGLARAPV